MAEAKALDVRRCVSAEEWRLRVDPAAAYRLVALNRWDDLVFTHISARVPGPEHHFLINPYGALFEEITASSLMKIDLEGNAVMESPFVVNPTGFVIHSAIIDGAGEFRRTATRGLGGQLVWPGLLRKLDRIDPGYAQ